MTGRAGVASASLVTINGARMADAAAQVSARDRGLTLADGLFETIRITHGRPFQLREHLDRLESGLRRLRIPMPVDLARWVAEAVSAADAADAALRITVTRGVGGAGLAVPREMVPTVIVAISPLPAFLSEIYARGLTAHVASGRRNDRSPSSGIKVLSYTDNVLALLEARERGADEALLLDTDDHLSEASASNLFFWTGTALVTPPVTCGALPGITRATVLSLARGDRLAVEERVCTLEDLTGAREAFLTSSLRGIAPLVRVEDVAIGAGAPGPVTQQLMQRHAALVQEDHRDA